MTAIIVFFLLHWFLSLFCQTFFLHRYAAHRMVTMSKFWEKFFYILTFITQGSSCLNPRGYAIMHRLHHAYSDTEKDPHSPHFFKSVFGMMWRTATYYHGINHRTLDIEERFTANVPEWTALDRFYDLWPVRVFWGVLYTCFYFHFMPNFWVLLLLPIHYVMGPIHGSIVNWCGHKYGYRNFKIDDKSRNTLVWDVLMMGELYQNNHHQAPNRLNFAARWFELDPAYPLIRILGWLRIIRMRSAPELNLRPELAS